MIDSESAVAYRRDRMIELRASRALARFDVSTRRKQYVRWPTPEVRGWLVKSLATLATAEAFCAAWEIP